MTIQFKKGLQKPSILTCIRKDGSTTWTSLRKEIEIHDFGHYAVETVLGFSKAFYGLLAEGYNIEDFELPREQRPEALIPANIPAEALQAEHIVNLLMVSLHQDDESLDFITTLTTILEENQIDFPAVLTSETLTRIEQKLKELMHQWHILQEGEILELSFSIS
ncbi:hypothetical protein POV27_04110 [Aureisphaera galaxeae]|uniref:hypothetical protein n=1 Tax=Aureisphaera galaxeae TaxID=1538023 RepID=UPI002350EA85|nr:hypothetical protein [Aureisphaera galaxeae]MDC8003219.1 hypothetical protein [Aureisphaera galaxeae]